MCHRTLIIVLVETSSARPMSAELLKRQVGGSFDAGDADFLSS